MLLDGLDQAFKQQFLQLFLALVKIRLVCPTAEDTKDSRVLDLEFERKSLLCVDFGLFYWTVGKSRFNVIRGIKSQGQSSILDGVSTLLRDLFG